MNIDDVRQARERIARRVIETPVRRWDALDAISGARLFFKCENLQKGGAFKFRGATNAVLCLSGDRARAGVATHSSGNHAAALALAAGERGLPATVVMPKDAARCKRAAAASAGAAIVDCEPTLVDRERTLEAVVAESGAAVVHPYDDERVIAGQGTAALELRAQADEPDILVVPVGGGGLASGTCLAAGKAKVFAVEPELADDAYRSLRTGERLGPRPPLTIADGLRTSLSDRTFAILKERLEGILLVSEEGILSAMRALWEASGLAVEPSGAAALAGVLAHPEAFRGRRVGVLLSGGNVDREAAGVAEIFR
jgi:threonine dehydratase